MIKDFFYRLKGDRKYFTIVFFILMLILVSGAVVPFYIESIKSAWPQRLSSEITGIENSVRDLYKEKENYLVDKSEEVQQELHKVLNPFTTTYRGLIRLVNSSRFDGFSLEVLAPNGRMIAWNENIAVPEKEIFPLNYPLGEVYFNNTELITYLTVTDTIHIESDIFYFVLSLPFEKHFELQNPYNREISFSRELSEKFYTQFEIDFNPFTQKSKDGKKYSFEILNNRGNKTGMAQFYKPALNSEIEAVYNLTGNIQAVLVVFMFLFLFLGFRKDFIKVGSRLVKLLLLLLYLSAFRALLYAVNFPGRILEGPLIEPAYFSSAFGWGIVKSPVEFFLTALFFLVICIQVFRYNFDYIKSAEPGSRKKLKQLLVLPLALLFLLLMRGLAASVKSVIFDSTLRYFKEPSLIPNFPSMVMILNVLVLGLSVILLLCCFVMLISFSFTSLKKEKLKKYYVTSFLLFQGAGILFLAIQKQPLLTPLLSIFFITVIFFLSYQLHVLDEAPVYSYIFASLAGSIITITLMNYFNMGLERQSLKTAALEINRPDENLLHFMIDETLLNAVNDQDVVHSFSQRNRNYDAICFIIWSRSSLQRESLNSSVAMYDKNFRLLGNFSVGIKDETEISARFRNYIEDKPRIVSAGETSSGSFLTGIIPVRTRGIISGYIAASAVYNFENIGARSIPDFIGSRKNLITSVVNVKELKIFKFVDYRIEEIYGDIYPSRDQVEPVLKAAYSNDNEVWLNLSLNEENYITYAIRSNNNGTETITSVSMREKEFTWNLFNFFKIFVIHSLYIFLFSLTAFFIKVRKSIPAYFSGGKEGWKSRYTFRTQLLFSFLLLSILPLIILAVYNRQIVSEKSRTAVFNELNERSNYLENHIREQKKKYPERDILDIFKNAGNELGISFAAFDNTNQIFNSREQYYKTGLFSKKLNPRIHYYLNYLSYREYLTNENIEDFNYDSFYKKFSLDNKNFIIGVNDAFNKIDIVFSTIEVDVFLFGIYSFAVIIIIVVSTILANKISAPIRRLTKATESVARGDLDVAIENKEHGEIGDLMDGFISMTRELRKNQVALAELERENAWKEMAKQVAHEIKNPLTPLKLAVQQLVASFRDKSKNFDLIFEKVTTTILNQVENLNLIASEFSRFAKMPSLKLEEVDLLKIIRESAYLFIDENIKINIETNLEKAFIEADINQLRRMMINLIRNSIQAGSTLINISIAYDEQKYITRVADNGSGIKEELKEKIFEANFSTKEKGMGLGLKMAKRFLEGIGGTIALDENSAGENRQGIIFRITIPSLDKRSEE